MCIAHDSESHPSWVYDAGGEQASENVYVRCDASSDSVLGEIGRHDPGSKDGLIGNISDQGVKNFADRMMQATLFLGAHLGLLHKIQSRLRLIRTEAKETSELTQNSAPSGSEEAPLGDASPALYSRLFHPLPLT